MDVGLLPFHTFSAEWLGSLTFPSLFPYGQADPTRNEAFCNFYLFLSHPRFWSCAYHILYRKILLGQKLLLQD